MHAYNLGEVLISADRQLTGKQKQKGYNSRGQQGMGKKTKYKRR
jgi:hypothetical protein